MNIDDLTLGQIKQLQNVWANTPQPDQLKSELLGKYVVVRCRDAGVHAGVLKSYNGRECFLTESRRLWYWKPANNSSFLSGVAIDGLHSDSKLGKPVDIHLTENCEINVCTEVSEKSIREMADYEQ
jgi:hypothetical protein